MGNVIRLCPDEQDLSRQIDECVRVLKSKSEKGKLKYKIHSENCVRNILKKLEQEVCLAMQYVKVG